MRDILYLTHDIEDVSVLKVARPCNAIIVDKQRRVVRIQGVLDLLLCPQEELPFLALAIGILRGIEATLRRDHLAHHILQCLFHDTLIEWILGDKMRMEIELTEQRIVI